jgi:hypothetical protein
MSGAATGVICVLDKWCSVRLAAVEERAEIVLRDLPLQTEHTSPGSLQVHAFWLPACGVVVVSGRQVTVVQVLTYSEYSQ